MMAWRVFCHTCRWLYKATDKNTVIGAGIEHRADSDDTHLVSVEELI